MPASITDLIDRIRRDQSSLGITLYEAASEAKLLAFERAKGIQLPADVRTFYQFCNGFESAEDLFRIIPLGEIITNGSDSYLVSPHDFHIAEYLIYCDMWTISVDSLNPEKYSIYNKVEEAVMLTSSFPEFLEVFLNQGVLGDGGLYDWRKPAINQPFTNPPSTSPNPSKVSEFSQELDQLAERVKQQLNLQYDAQGVKFVEGFIERNKAHTAPEEWQGLITSLGAFLGHCIMLNYGGSWRQDDENGTYLAFDEQNKVFPFTKVTKQFKNGLEDSVYSFYTVIPAAFKLAPLVPAAPPVLVRRPWYKFW